MLLAGAVLPYLNLLKNEHDTRSYTLLKLCKKMHLQSIHMAVFSLNNQMQKQLLNKNPWCVTKQQFYLKCSAAF